MASIAGDAGSTWQFLLLDVGKRSTPFQISMVKVDENYNGITAIDDINFIGCNTPLPSSCDASQFQCTITHVCVDEHDQLCDGVDDCGDNTDEVSCIAALVTTFDSGLNGWTQETSYDEFDWSIQTGDSATFNTGPLRDHTFSTKLGFYAVINAAPMKPGDRAWLNSQPLQARTNCELRFWYYMYGVDVYRLSIYAKTHTNGGWNHLKDYIGEASNSMVWHRATLPLDMSDPYMVVIEGVVGNGGLGNIAIDDVSFSTECAVYNGNLPTLPVVQPPSEPPSPDTCNPTSEFTCRQSAGDTCISVEQVCDFRSDCLDNSDESTCVDESCDFESGWCGWISGGQSGDVNGWTKGKGATLLPNESGKRPATDHSSSTDSGFYIFADSTQSTRSSTAQLTSPTISKSGPQCTLRFFYWMGTTQNDAVGSLHIAAINSWGSRVELLEIVGFQGSGWMEARAFIGPFDNFQVLLEVRDQALSDVDISLDDLQFMDCAPSLPASVCAPTQFTCANQVCIEQSKICDFTQDCGDGSDELQALCYQRIPRCDFEYDLCGFVREVVDIQWQLSTPAALVDGSLQPPIDHTLHGPEGHYLFADPMTSVDSSHNGKARIGTPGLFKPSASGCIARFYYHVMSTSDTLRVYTRTAWTSNPLEGLNIVYTNTDDPSYTGPGNFWQRADVSVSAATDFQVIFESSHTSGAYTSSIAIDDITFSDVCEYDETGSHGEVPTPPPQPSECGEGYYPCAAGGCYTDMQRCDFMDACNDAQPPNAPSDEKSCGSSCTFDTDGCGWTNSEAATYKFDWVRSSSLGPPSDHTTGSNAGSYMVVTTGPSHNPGAKAHLTTDEYQRAAASCKMSFFCNMNSNNNMGNDIGILRVIKKSKLGTTVLLNIPGSQGSSWTQTIVSIGQDRNFEVVFEVENGGVSGYVAVDDIVFSGCGDQTSGGMCDAGSFQCSDGQCIFADEVCDMREDCDDGSDETSCTLHAGDCTFEGQVWAGQTGCQYVQNLDDNADWVVTGSDLGNGNIVTSGPSSDHTPSAGGSGSYVMVDIGSIDVGSVVRFTTGEAMPASEDICHVRFWYFMSGTETSTILRTYVVASTGARLRASTFYGNTGSPAWQYASVVVSSNVVFRVEFEAEAGNHASSGGIIAIDDITFTDACRQGHIATPAPVQCSSHEFSCTNNGVVECMPTTWKCDGFIDCSDGSDELGCPPVTNKPGTTPQQNTGKCKDNQFRCSDDACISGLLVCDGVADCTSGEDELACPVITCAVGQFFCGDDGGACLSSSLQCDAQVDCSYYQADESVCGVCPLNYCQNNGQCKIATNGAPYCQCAANYVGTRCNTYKTNEPTTSGISGGAVAGIVIGCIIAVVLLMGGAYYYLTKDRKWHRKLERGYDNPIIYDTSYGSSTFATEMTTSGASKRPEEGFSNPGFDDGLQRFGDSGDVYATVGQGPSRRKDDDSTA